MPMQSYECGGVLTAQELDHLSNRTLKRSSLLGSQRVFPTSTPLLLVLESFEKSSISVAGKCWLLVSIICPDTAFSHIFFRPSASLLVNVPRGSRVYRQSPGAISRRCGLPWRRDSVSVSCCSKLCQSKLTREPCRCRMRPVAFVCGSLH